MGVFRKVRDALSASFDRITKRSDTARQVREASSRADQVRAELLSSRQASALLGRVRGGRNVAKRFPVGSSIHSMRLDTRRSALRRMLLDAIGGNAWCRRRTTRGRLANHSRGLNALPPAHRKLARAMWG